MWPCPILAQDPITAAIIWTFIVKTAVTVAISVGLSLLAQKLFGQDPKSADTSTADPQSRSWNPHTTEREGIVRPRAYGRNMHHGNIVAKWTDVTNPAMKVGFGCYGDMDVPPQGTIKVYGKYEVIVEFPATEPVIDRVSYHRYWQITGGTNDFGGYEKVYFYYGGAWNLINTKNYTVKGEGEDTISITAGGPWHDVSKVKIESYLYMDLELPCYRTYVYHYLYELKAWDTARTTYYPGGTVECNILGQHEVRSWYTNTANFNTGEGTLEEREVLYMIIEHGDGPTQGVGSNAVYLNDQPATNFGDVSIRERTGTMDQTVMEGFEKTKLEYELGNELVYGNPPIIFTTPNDYFDDLEYTLVFPQGLYKYSKDGDRSASSHHVRVRISVHGLEDWTVLFSASITAEKVTPWFKLYKLSGLGFNCVRGTQYDLDFTSYSATGDRHVNNVHIKSVREVVDVAFARPGKALIGIRAIATSQLSGNIDVKVVREDRLIWNGATGSIEYSRNRAWVVFDVLTQPIISGNGDTVEYEIERYEGISPDKLDLAFFLEWAEWCEVQVLDGYGEESTEDRMACDLIVDFETDIWTLVNEIAQIGRAYLYWQGHTLTGWIDKPVDDVIDLVTMDNVMLKSWRSAWTGKDTLAGMVEVFFQDSRQGYERTHVPFGNENAGTYTQAISIEGIGITTRGTAIHVAHHALERNRLIRNVNNFRTYKDAFRYRLGDVVMLQHRVPNWGQAYRVVKSDAANTVELDRIVDAVAEDILYIRTYNDVGEVVGIYAQVIESCVGRVVTITGSWTVPPVKNNIVAIDGAGAIKLRRITKIEPTVDNYFDVTVETYDEQLFEADDPEWDPDCPDKNYIWPGPAGQPARPPTQQTVVDLIARLLPPQPVVEYSRITFMTPGGGSYEYGPYLPPEPELKDYHNTDDTSFYPIRVYSPYHIIGGHTFTPDESYTLTFIKLKLSRIEGEPIVWNDGVQLNITIHEVTDGSDPSNIILGAALSTISSQANLVATPSANKAWYEFELTTPIIVSAEQEYAIVVDVPNNPDQMVGALNWWRSGPIDLYVKGRFLGSVEGGAIWAVVGYDTEEYFDGMFENWGY